MIEIRHIAVAAAALTVSFALPAAAAQIATTTRSPSMPPLPKASR
jgi:hypothetical protein